MPCEHYEGSYYGDIQSPILVLDTSFTNSPTIIEIAEGVNDSINLTFDFSSFFGVPQGTQLINFNQAYWVDSTIVGQFHDLRLVPVYYDLEAINSNNYQELQGTITISEEATGTLTFHVVR